MSCTEWNKIFLVWFLCKKKGQSLLSGTANLVAIYSDGFLYWIQIGSFHLCGILNPCLLLCFTSQHIFLPHPPFIHTNRAGQLFFITHFFSLPVWCLNLMFSAVHTLFSLYCPKLLSITSLIFVNSSNWSVLILMPIKSPCGVLKALTSRCFQNLISPLLPHFMHMAISIALSEEYN